MRTAYNPIKAFHPGETLDEKLQEMLMLDRDLAQLYGVETKVLNQAVKRNMERFPSEFMFQPNYQELANLKSQFVTAS